MIQRLPFIFLIASCLIFSIHFKSRYGFPIHDEALYSMGDFLHLPGWGPLYQLYYSFLNFITKSYVDSFYTNIFILTFIGVPISIFFYLRKIKFSSFTASLVAFLFLISSWNFPSNPKVQVFNFIILLISMIIRDKSTTKKSISNSILILSLYVRIDNLIILLCCLSWDLFLAFNEKKVFNFLKTLIAPLLLLITIITVFYSPMKDSRSWAAFSDHFYWRNPEFFEEDRKNNLSIQQSEVKLFGEEKSILHAISTHPKLVLKHFNQNLYYTPKFLIQNFRTVILDGHNDTSQSNFFVCILILLIILTSRIDHLSLSETSPFLIGLVIKSFLVAIVLQPMDKYIFELNFVIIVLLCYLSSRFLTLKNLKWQHPALLGIVCSILIFFPYKEKVFVEETPIKELVSQIQYENRIAPVKYMISNLGVHHWSEINSHNLNLWVNRRFDRKLKTDLHRFFKAYPFDLIVLEPNMRGLLKDVGLKDPFERFEENYQEFGYQLNFGTPKEGATIYRKAQ